MPSLTPKTTLYLPLKRIYFEQIKAGTKLKEFRLDNPYWRKRLEDKNYDQLVLTLGYPAAGDHDKRLTLPWRGFVKETITHPHFGNVPVDVFAIAVDVREKIDVAVF